MCGIAGISRHFGGAVDLAALRKMIATLLHRGPDGSGVFQDGPVGLGHTRLSIIDIGGGQQPMSNREGTVWISFNGEIFNYVELRADLRARGWSFTTESDTEVIIRLYEEKGERCVEYLNGQWAFAIWDRRSQKLFLSRDRLGVRPLFYTTTTDSFLFASEIKALFAYGPHVVRKLDLRALDQIFTLWTTLPPRTPFAGISQLPPGHSMTVEGRDIRIRRYWLPEYEEGDDCAEGASLERKTAELLNLLLDATRIRLRSDVPVGAYLSGGLDSTLITALMKSVRKDTVKTFSVAFNDPEFDESRHQLLSSGYLDTEHERIRCATQDIGAVFPRVVWHAEHPLLRTAPAPLFRLAEHVHRSGFKVVLTGEGADEMFGGYDIFKEAKLRRFWAAQPDSKWRHLLLSTLYPYMPHMRKLPIAYTKQFFHIDNCDLKNPFFSHLPRWRLTSKLKLLLSEDVRSELGGYDVLSELEEHLPPGYNRWHPFCQAQYLETSLLLPGYILSSQGDRMSMAHSVEGRFPFLDYRVVDFAARLSPSLKMKVLNEKYLLKRVSKGLIPPEISHRAKQPYRAPDGKSFFGSKPDEYITDILSEHGVRRSGVFSDRGVAALVDKFKSGQAPGARDNMALVGVLSTQVLLDKFIHCQAPASAVAANPNDLVRPLAQN